MFAAPAETAPPVGSALAFDPIIASSDPARALVAHQVLRRPAPARPGVLSFPVGREVRYMAIVRCDLKRRWATGVADAVVRRIWRVESRNGPRNRVPRRRGCRRAGGRRWP